MKALLIIAVLSGRELFVVPDRISYVDVLERVGLGVQVVRCK